jgi:hypothetical protein
MSTGGGGLQLRRHTYAGYDQSGRVHLLLLGETGASRQRPACNKSPTNQSTTAATTNIAAGTYPITATLDDPGDKLPNYSVTTNDGILTITNAAISNYTATISLTNSLVSQALIGTTNYTFTDPVNDLSVVVALTMTAYSASNASPTFKELDNYGSVGRPVHLGVDSGIAGGDGNFVEPYEGANFSTTLVSVSTGIVTNTVKFGISGIGFRFSPVIAWSSSAGSTNVTMPAETLYPMDTSLVSLVGTDRGAIANSQQQFLSME